MPQKMIKWLLRKKWDTFDNWKYKVDEFHKNGMIFESTERPNSKGNILKKDLVVIKRDKPLPFNQQPNDNHRAKRKKKVAYQGTQKS